MKLTRRNFFKGVGAGTALAGLGSMARPAPVAAKTVSGSTAAPLPREIASALLARLQSGESTDPLAAHTVQIAPNMEWVIPHEDQMAARGVPGVSPLAEILAVAARDRHDRQSSVSPIGEVVIDGGEDHRLAVGQELRETMAVFPRLRVHLRHRLRGAAP